MSRELWPVNVSRLHDLRLTFTHKCGHDISMRCPACGGNLAIHEFEPWHMCHGFCAVNALTFPQLFNVLKDGVKP